MTSVPTLFNRKMLDKHLLAIAAESIPGYEAKRGEMRKWKGNC